MPSQMLVPFILANAFGIVFLVLALFRPNVARLIAGGGFVVASLVNGILAVRNPQIYVTGFEPYAIGVYKMFITGVLKQAPGRLILAVALWQLFVGIMILVNRTDYVRIGLLAATVWLIGISGLGLGCAFPGNLILAAGTVSLIRLQWPRQTRGAATSAS